MAERFWMIVDTTNEQSIDFAHKKYRLPVKDRPQTISYCRADAEKTLLEWQAKMPQASLYLLEAVAHCKESETTKGLWFVEEVED